MKTGFYAYSSRQPLVAEVIANAIKGINTSGYEIKVTDWQDLNISGKWIINEVLIAIDDSDVFLCDLTTINLNVLFELGYAIATNKRVWISRASTDVWTTDDNHRDRIDNELGLRTIGYREYRSSEDLTGFYLSDAPFDDLENTFYRQKIRQLIGGTDPTLLYLMSKEKSDASNMLTRAFRKSKLPLTIDDPDETETRSLAWYLDKVFNSFGVVAHLAANAEDFKNAKYAFISGLSRGAGRALLMLAEHPYDPALDYRDLMYIYKSAKQCEIKGIDWANENKGEYFRIKDIISSQTQKRKARHKLEQLKFGEYEAESEVTHLSDYFVETAAYRDLPQMFVPPFMLVDRARAVEAEPVTPRAQAGGN